LGYRSVDRKVVVEKAAAGGVSRKAVHDALLKPPSPFDWLESHLKNVYLVLLQAALAEEVQDGKVVYHGYAGHLLLRDAGPVFRVRIIATKELRLQMTQDHLGLEGEAALAHMQKVDQQRKKWTQALYGVDWEDPSLYDLVLNLGRLFDVEEASDIIASMVRKQKCLQSTPEQQSILRDFALASRVRASLAMELPALKLQEVKAKDGSVSISISASFADDHEQLLDVEYMTGKVPGVKSVEVRYRGQLL
jgi:hypothetical protein